LQSWRTIAVTLQQCCVGPNLRCRGYQETVSPFA
jgi:hypothetical protein